MRVIITMMLMGLVLNNSVLASEPKRTMPINTGPVRVVPMVTAISSSTTVVRPYFYFSDKSIYTLDAQTWECMKSMPWLALSPEQPSCERPVAKGSLVAHNNIEREASTPSPTALELLQESNEMSEQSETKEGQ